MRRTLLLALIIVSLTACKQQTTTTYSNNNTPSFTSSCTIGKWKPVNLPLNLKVSQEFLNDFVAADMVNNLNPIEQTGKVWNQAIANNTFFTVPMNTAAQTGYASSGSFYDNEMGIYKSHTWFSDVSSNALAITQYYGYSRTDASLGSYIDLTHADIIFNYRDFQFTTSSNFLNGYDIQTVLLHEMGHFLGLCHDDAHTSIMRPRYISTQRTLFSFDITKITDLYVNNKNTLATSQALSTSNAITIPEGTLIRGRVELLSNGECKHYENGVLVYEHYVSEIGQKKGPVKNRAFSKILSNYKKLF